jgi:hypothetical protein
LNLFKFADTLPWELPDGCWLGAPEWPILKKFIVTKALGTLGRCSSNSIFDVIRPAVDTCAGLNDSLKAEHIREDTAAA